MKLKKLNEELSSLKILYEDAILRKASSDEIKTLLQKIDDVNKLIADINSNMIR